MLTSLKLTHVHLTLADLLTLVDLT